MWRLVALSGGQIWYVYQNTKTQTGNDIADRVGTTPPAPFTRHTVPPGQDRNSHRYDRTVATPLGCGSLSAEGTHTCPHYHHTIIQRTLLTHYNRTENTHTTQNSTHCIEFPFTRQILTIHNTQTHITQMSQMSSQPTRNSPAFFAVLSFT